MGREQPEATMNSASLLPILRPGLHVVFVGTEPGPDSLRLGHYYANPNNSFYKDLKSGGFTSAVLTPECDRELLSHGIGLDDVYDDPGAFSERVKNVAPQAVCFNSRRALERYAGRKITRPWKGGAAAAHAKFAGVSIVWALHDSSGQARQYHDQRVMLLRQLKDLLDRPR